MTRAPHVRSTPARAALCLALVALWLLAPFVGLAQEAPGADDAAPPTSGEGASGTSGEVDARRVTDLRGDDPAELADRAVQRWLESRDDPPALQALAGDPDAFCRELPALFAAPPAGPDTTVNIDDRQERPVDPAAVPEGAERRRYTYSARTGDTLQVVEAIVERPVVEGPEGGGRWRPVSVGFFQPAGNAGRAWLRTPLTAGIFVVLTLLVVLDLVRGGRIRRWLGEGFEVLRRNRGIVLTTVVALYGVFALGMAAGSTLPASCADAVQTILEGALNDVGASQAVASGNPAIAATVIFFQNYVVVTISVLFGAALLFGVPAYLLAAVSFFVQAVPFGLLGGGGDAAAWIFIGVLLLLELTAYFLVVAGGGIFLKGIVRRGFAGLGDSFRELALTLPIAGVLLLVGAWYEALVLLLGG